MGSLSTSAVKRLVTDTWRSSITPALQAYIEVPALSPAFDAAWAEHGHLARATAMLADWARARTIAGAQVEVVTLPGRTPLVFIDVPAHGITPSGGADADGGSVTGPTVLLYGHLDKQPEMTGWRQGLGPWIPVIDGDRLYGRGGADDGYAMFAALTAIESIQAAGGSHARCVLLIEASEESGSTDLATHVEALAPRIGEVDLVMCLDSGCATYDRLWTTTSLRGLARIAFTVRVLTEGVHSGAAGGVVPSSFRVARALLDRIEDPLTGELLLPELRAEVPAERRAAAEVTAELLGSDWAARAFPWAGGTHAHEAPTAEHLLDRTWRGALEVIGADGWPPTAAAGNVLRPSTTLSLAMRLAPHVDAEAAADAVRRVLTSDVPGGAQVEVDTEHASGWAAPACSPWLADALEDASREAFGAPHSTMGEGGGIPFMGMLAQRFPRAQFVVAGVLGPESNAHGPNEFLHLAFAERLTVAMALILERHAHQARPDQTGSRS